MNIRATYGPLALSRICRKNIGRSRDGATPFMRLAIAGPFDPKTAASGVKRRIAASAGFLDFEAFVAALDETRKKVREAYEAVVKG